MKEYFRKLSDYQTVKRWCMGKTIKVISALNNQLIQGNLRMSYEDLEFILEDISYQEGLLEAQKTMSPDALIINLDIEGDLDRFSFIQAVRDINDTIKVILIVKTEDKEYNNWLISKGVYDIFIDGKCTFQNIYDALIREQKVIIKKEIQKEYIEKVKIVTREKVVREVVSVNFKKLVLGVWGNAEFSCELAYMAARLTKFRVLLLNLDFISPTVDTYLNIPDRLNGPSKDPPGSSGFSYAIEAFEKKHLSSKIFEQACLKKKELNNLYILFDTGDIGSYEKYKEKDIQGFIEQLHRDFDLVILILNKSIYDTFALAALSKSDYNIIPIHANADAVKEFESCFLGMNVRNYIPIEKCRFVAFEYKNGINYPVHHLKDIFTENYFLGVISYAAERELYRNLNSCYARWIYRKNPSEYINILSKFNILPERQIRHRVRDWLVKRASRIIKKQTKRNEVNKHE